MKIILWIWTIANKIYKKVFYVKSLLDEKFHMTWVSALCAPWAEWKLFSQNYVFSAFSSTPVRSYAILSVCMEKKSI